MIWLNNSKIKGKRASLLKTRTPFYMSRNFQLMNAEVLNQNKTKLNKLKNPNLI